MNVLCDPGIHALSVSFPAEGGRYVESEEFAPGVVLDFDTDGRVIAVHIMDLREVVAAATPAAQGSAAE